MSIVINRNKIVIHFFGLKVNLIKQKSVSCFVIKAVALDDNYWGKFRAKYKMYFPFNRLDMCSIELIISVISGLLLAV